MADAEEKAKAEKMAAAKKRVEQLKKKKAKSASKKTETAEDSAAETALEVPAQPSTPEIEIRPEQEDVKPEEAKSEEVKPQEGSDSKDAEETVSELSNTTRERQSSLSIQSKLRSSTFRQASGGGPLSPGYGFSPDGESAPDIYRKQAAKIDELERENKKLVKDVSDGERRWKKAEDELDDIREAEVEKSGILKEPLGGVSSPDELEKLQSEIASLKRQNTQLQVQSTRGIRHGSSPSVSMAAPPNFEAELASKSSTIESMEIEISNLRAQVERLSSGNSEKEQITALEEKLTRSERAAAIAQRELGDLKKNLDRTTEKAVREGSERISAETKLRTMEKETQDAKARGEELQKKVDALEKKVATLATLHKEQDARFQAQKRDLEKADKEASELRARFAGVDNENLRLREERERTSKKHAEGVDDEGVDELENEERQRLEKKVRELEGEVHELRRGVWRERRKELDGEESSGVTSPGARFTDVDLSGGISPNRRRSMAAQGRGFGDFITSGLNAITGANVNTANDDSLLDDDDDMDFDEDAFRLAQEEEGKKRIERIKEVKRGLKNWEGWRLDLVEHRRGGGEGVGEIFEV